MIEYNGVLEKCDPVHRVLERGWVPCKSGKKSFQGAISEVEAETIRELIILDGCKLTLETGVANGISTLAVTSAVKLNNGCHYGIDPCQGTDHDWAAQYLISEFGLEDSFVHLDGPTHIEAAKLLGKDRKFDLIFIDGHHNFDYKFIDLFMADQLLKKGGILIFHDLLLQSTKKIYRFINSNYGYELINNNYAGPNFGQKLRYVIGAFLKGRSYWWWWPNSFRNLLVLRKIKDSNHSWDFFSNF